MPVTIRQSGEAGLFGQLGKLAGEAVQSRQEQEYAERAASEARQMQQQKELLQRQQEFQQARDQLQMQLELEKEKRAGLWALEKAEMSSRLDFQRGETLRAKQLDQLEAAKAAIDKSDGLSYEQKSKEKLRLETEVLTGLQISDRTMYPERFTGNKAQSTKDQLGQFLSDGSTPAAAAAPTPAAPGSGQTVFQGETGSKYVYDPTTDTIRQTSFAETAPASETEFLAEVRRRTLIDRGLGQQYYNKYVTQFTGTAGAAIPVTQSKPKAFAAPTMAQLGGFGGRGY